MPRWTLLIPIRHAECCQRLEQFFGQFVSYKTGLPAGLTTELQKTFYVIKPRNTIFAGDSLVSTFRTVNPAGEVVHPINWKKKFGGMGVTELRRLRQLEDENQRLKNLVWTRRCCRRYCSEAGSEASGGAFFCGRLTVSVSGRGCELLMQSRTVYHWQSWRDDRR